MQGGVLLSGCYEEHGCVKLRLCQLGHPYANEHQCGLRKKAQEELAVFKGDAW